MPDILVDVRCLQDAADRGRPAGRHAISLLGAAQGVSALRGCRLIGVVDRDLPPLPVHIPPLFDHVRDTPYPGAMQGLTGFVQLSPMNQDPFFTARLLRNRAIPAAAVVFEPPDQAEATQEQRLDHHIALRWLARYDLFLPVSQAAAAWLHWVLRIPAESMVVTGNEPGAFWSAIAQRLQPLAAPATIGAAMPRVALLTALPPSAVSVAPFSAALCAEFGKRVELHVFTGTANAACPAGATSAGSLSSRPLLSPYFDRTVSMLGHGGVQDGVMNRLFRFGGACIAHEPHLLHTYVARSGIERTAALARAELGRPLGPQEIHQWLGGEMPPKALLLGEIAAVAEPLILHSAAAAQHALDRNGRPALCIPVPVPAVHASSTAREAARQRAGLASGETLIVSAGAARTSEDCVWALYMLHEWGMRARLALPAAAGGEALRRLCRQLGLAGHVSFPGGADHRNLLLAAEAAIVLRPGTGPSVSAALADCASAGLRCVASRCFADAIAAPAWVRPLPDQTSPVLLAEALTAVLAQAAPSVQDRAAFIEEHGFAAFARRLCEALLLPP